MNNSSIIWTVAAFGMGLGLTACREAALADATSEPKAPVPLVGQASWPVIRGNAEMHGVAAETLPAPLKLAWKFPMKGPITATAAIAEGAVFLGSNEGDFHAIDLVTGQARWSAKPGDFIESSACYAEGKVFVGSDDGNLYALDAKTGKEVWRFKTEGELKGGINFLTKGGKTYLYAGSYDNKLYCVDAANGQKVWEVETGNYVNGAPAVAEGKVIFGGCDAVLYMVDAVTGESRDKIEIGSYIANSVAVADGSVYVAHYSNAAEAYDLKEKKPRWKYEDKNFAYFASPAVQGNFVYVANRGKRLLKLDREKGTVAWEFKARRSMDSSPVVSGGLVYIGSDDGRVYAVDVETGAEKWSYEIGKAITASPAIAGGYLVIGSQDGTAYAFSKS